MGKKKGKNDKLILYEAFLQNKYKNCNQEDDTDIGELFFRSVRHVLWLFWNIFLYLMTGIALIMLLNEGTRRAFYELLLHR